MTYRARASDKSPPPQPTSRIRTPRKVFFVVAPLVLVLLLLLLLLLVLVLVEGVAVRLRPHLLRMYRTRTGFKAWRGPSVGGKEGRPRRGGKKRKRSEMGGTTDVRER